MFTISKKFEFSASHALDGLPDDHPCARIHGHNYVVELVLQASVLAGPGFVRDYGELKTFKQWLDAWFDHQWLGYGTLNHYVHGNISPRVSHGVVDFNPTAENLAKYFYEYAITLYPEVVMARVSETPKTWAEYSPQNLTLEFVEDLIKERGGE
jgi:6-pyruvoyltetrahydropterin/6-carboxytetrahydropterin synthase